MTKQRRGLQRREAPDNTRQSVEDDNGNEHVMTQEEFAKWKPTLMRLQLWRPFTAFLFLGKLDLYYGFTLQFVWM